MRSSSKFYLTKRSNGFYYVGYFDDGRLRWKSTRATIKPDALRALTNFEQMFREKTKAVSFSVFKRDILQYVETNYAKRTYIIYEQALTHLTPIAGDGSLTSLTAQHLEKYKSSRLTGEKPVQPATVNIEIRAIKAAFNTAVRWQLLERNPFAGVKCLHVPERIPEYFTHEQFTSLIHKIDEFKDEKRKKRRWLKEVVLFAVGTGMRQAEVLNLRWTDVDLSRKLIHIESNSTFKTKSGKRRTIPMSDVVHVMLSTMRRKGEYVFMMKGRRIFESYLTHAFKDTMRAAKLPENLHWHSLRHTHASYLVQAGVPILAVSKLLGHSSVRVTEKHYAALAPESLHDEVNRLHISLN